MTETIVAAAIVYDGEVWTLPPPARHCDVISKHFNETGKRGSGDRKPEYRFEHQGFVTSTGRFVGREEAGRIALAAGQTPKLKWGDELFSEDLW